MGSSGIRRRKQERRESFDLYEARRLSKRRQSDFLETELPGLRRSGPAVLLLYLVAAFLVWSGMGTGASDRFLLSVQTIGAVLGLVLGVCALALTYRVWWSRGQYRIFIAEQGRFPTHEEAIAMKGRLHAWPIQRLRVLATLIFWFGAILSVVFLVLIVRNGGTPITRTSPGINAAGFVVSGIVLGIGCLFGGVYAEKRGRPFGGILNSLGRRTSGHESA